MSKYNSVVKKTKVDNCIFCGASNPTSEEHILSAWIFKALKKAGIPYSQTNTIFHTDAYGEATENIQVRADAATAPILCENCNKQWGKNIQDKVAPILRPFILGGWCQLTHLQLEKIRRWFTSYLMVREMHHDNHETHSQTEREEFRWKGRYPKHLNVWMAPLEKFEIASTHRPFIILDHTSPEKLYRMHILVQCVGHLMFVSYGGDMHADYGNNSLPHLLLNQYLTVRGFVQIMHPDKNFIVNFPSIKPQYFGFPGEYEFCDDVTQQITDAFDGYIKTRKLWRSFNKLLKECKNNPNADFLSFGCKYAY